MNEPGKEPLHQTKLSADITPNLAAGRSRSFRRMVNALRSLSA